MATPTTPSHSLRTLWVLTWVLPMVVPVAVGVLFASSFRFESPDALFLTVTIAASVCVITSIAVMRRAFRTNEAELACLGSFFFAVSVLPLIHGITTPGVLFDQNSTTTLSMFLAIPAGLLSVAPFVARRSGAARWLRAHWRNWVALAVTATTFLGLAVLVAPGTLPSVEMGHPVTIAITVASILGCIAMSYRHLTLARIAQRRGPLVISLSFGLVGASAVMWSTADAYSAGFWMAHAVDTLGVLLGTVGAVVVYRRSATMEQVVGPILLTEPLTALAVGMDPVVHRFIADLDAKDSITRDHVIRTTELAVRVGEEMRIGPMQLRDLGLAAILHDIGKVGVPDEILNKPGRLTPGEFAIMREHAEIGERMVLSSPVIASIAPAVRGHHERMDGGGYPDGLVGYEISQNARIVAVCDAYDAMANSRQYRAGMGHDKAVAILREHAGSQWDPVAVEALVMTLARQPMTQELHIQIDKIGRDLGVDSQGHIGCGCLPDAALAQLEAAEAAEQPSA